MGNPVEEAKAETEKIIRQLVVDTVVDILDTMIDASTKLHIDYVPLTSVVAAKERVKGWVTP